MRRFRRGIRQFWKRVALAGVFLRSLPFFGWAGMDWENNGLLAFRKKL